MTALPSKIAGHPVLGSVLWAATAASGFLGVILLLEVHEGYGICAVAACFLVRILSARYAR
jgi:hypothetical protein